MILRSPVTQFDRFNWLIAPSYTSDHVDALGRTELQNAIRQGNDASVTAPWKPGAAPNADVKLRLRP
ncbi:hypothetical protein C6P77_13390 [Burkholderia ambifaria]|nr:hypothetical protein C6P77_13390 [Burkholderia ambifaria]